ncbi:hypothetical protein P5V15_011140 [Pogonomyrmex californicus]
MRFKSQVPVALFITPYNTRPKMEDTTCLGVQDGMKIPDGAVLVVTLIVAGIAIMLHFIVSKRSSSRQASSKTTFYNYVPFISKAPQASKSPLRPVQQSSLQQQPHLPDSSGKRGKSKKRREVQQDYTHPWLAGTLKGHTGIVTDMDFSSNGRHFASCAEDKHSREPGNIRSSKQQRKNRKKEAKTSRQSTTEEINMNRITGNKKTGKASRSLAPSQAWNSPSYLYNYSMCTNDDLTYRSYRTEITYMTDVEIAMAIRTYLLLPSLMFFCGYPVPSVKYNVAVINNISYPIRGDSSPDSSDQEQEAQSPRYKTEKSSENSNNRSRKKKVSSTQDGVPRKKSHQNDGIPRNCVRCSRIYFVDLHGQFLKEEDCIYHNGKLREFKSVWHWTCCQQPEHSTGCTKWTCHVWFGLYPGVNELRDFVTTYPPSVLYNQEFDFSIYALDCEMCYTIQGMELVRVSITNMWGQIVYDTLVQTNSPVLDYNTRYSGITEQHMERVTKTLWQVREDLLRFISSQTILVGHSLGNDLRALKIIHSNVVDVSFTFPHSRGYPYRMALKTLAKNILKRNIQEGTHNSIEDARAAMDMILMKVHLMDIDSRRN